jgi:CheY-like chemotaxis protein
MQGKCCTKLQETVKNCTCKSVSEQSEALILVVDGDADNLELTSKLIHYYGFQVMTAANGREAFKIFQEYQPTMAVVELMLPDIDGIDFARLIRASTYSTPIIALTSLPSHLFYEQTLRAGFNAYIEKPFDFDTLEHVLTRCLTVSTSLS